MDKRHYGARGENHNAQIKNEGPLRLAGDTVMVSLLAEKQDEEIVLRVLAYASGAQSGVFSPVMAKGTQKDSSGRLLVEEAAVEREPSRESGYRISHRWQRPEFA